jgi:hypothetical protein
MEDRQLTELAAKAINLPVRWDDLHERFLESRIVQANGGIFERDWIPLDDDGDALRLAIALNLPIIPHTHGAGWVDVGYIKELCGADPLAATRRAIVRAAARIGEQHDPAIY